MEIWEAFEDVLSGMTREGRRVKKFVNEGDCIYGWPLLENHWRTFRACHFSARALARPTVQVIKGQNAFCVVGLDLNRAPASTHF